MGFRLLDRLIFASWGLDTAWSVVLQHGEYFFVNQKNMCYLDLN